MGIFLASFSFSCTTANTSTTVSSCASTVLLYPGLIITGTNIPADTVVSSITSASAFVISRAAEGSATNTMTFNRAAPAGWDMDAGVVSSASTPVITYVDNGVGGDLRWGDGYIVKVQATTGTNQQLRYTLTNLAASTTYKVVARVVEAASDDVCQLSTTGGASDLGAQSSEGTAWQTLSGTFTTASTLDTVDINLITAAVGDICSWDHIEVYQVGDTTTDRDEVNYSPGAVVVTKAATLAITCNTSYDGNCDSAATGLEVILTPPAPGYLIMVYGKVHVDMVEANRSCTMRLASGSGVTNTTLREARHQTGADQDPEVHTDLLAQHTIVNPTPGAPLTIGIDIKGTDCGLLVNISSYIEAVMIPTR